MNDEIPIEKLVANNYNPRKRFDSAMMKELEGSIKNQGIVQAITVRPLDGDKYEVVAGMRRYMAAKNIGLEKIPAMIRILSDEEAKLLSITENLERADLTPIEEARAFTDYLGWDEQHHFEDGRQEGITAVLQLLASKIPMSERTIQNRLSLLHLPESLQIKIDQKTLDLEIAYQLTRLRQLWELKITGLTNEEIEENRQKIKSEIHEIMDEVAKTVKTEGEARIRVNKYIETAQLNLQQKVELSSKLKKDLEEAYNKLLEFYNELKELPPNWGEMDNEQKIEWTLLHIESNIKKLTTERLDIISKQRALKTSQHDRYLMNLSYVKNLVLDTCPHCGAGISVKYLERKIKELQEEIESLSNEEEEAGGELKDWRDKNKKFDKIRRDYESKLTTYNASLKEVSK